MSTIKSKTYSTQVRVIYADTDQMGVVNNAKYLDYFESGRNEFLRQAGYPYKGLEAAGIYLPIREVKLNYFHPAVYDDLLEIQCWAEQVEGKALRLTMHCKVYNQEGKKITAGYTEHILTDQHGHPLRLKGPERNQYLELINGIFPLEVSQ